MNRICLKRKQMLRKTSLNQPVEPFTNENAEGDRFQGLTDASNTPIGSPQGKAANQDYQSNQRLFQQFKIQYDQLRHNYQNQRLSYDEVLQQKKRLEIQIMNNNPQFYEKEIKRLRSQVQKLQQQNEDYKHKFILAQNSKKQLQATVKVRNQELKKTIQLIEKQKISCVELKHQLNEKQKLFQRITGQMEKSNNVLSQSFQDSNTRIQKLQYSLKSKIHDLDALQRNYDHLAKKLTETERVMKNNKEIFDQTNFKKSQTIDELETKLRSLTRTSRETIQGLEVKLQQVKNQRKTQNLLIGQHIQTNKNLKLQRMNELQIVRLQQTNKQIKCDYQDKCQLVKKLQEKLLGTCPLQEYSALEKKIKQEEQKKNSICKQYEEKIIKLQKDIQTIKLSHFRNPGQETGITHDFQELLRVQLDQNSKVKRQLSIKIDEIYNLKADMDELKCKLRVNQDQIAILNKKIKSQQKNHKIQADVSSQNLKNQIDSLKRKLDMTQSKVDQKNKQIKEKQNFIMTTIIGRSRQQDVPLIVAEMQRIFEADYATRLSAALHKIQELEKK